MEAPVNKLVAAEICERNRWVRFRKRTHWRGVLGRSGSELGGNYCEIHDAAYPLCQETPGSVDGVCADSRNGIWGVVDLRGGFC